MSANQGNTPQSHATGAAVLVIGEHSTDALTLASKLDRSTDSGAHYSLVVAPTRDDAMRLLAAQNYAVIVQSMLGSTKEYVETLRYLRTNARNTNTSLILIAPNDLDHAHAMRTLEGGAVDCIDKPADEFVLRAKVKMFVDMARTTARLNEVQGRDSINDPLTGLPTRLLMMDRVGQAIRHAGRTNGRVALAVIDLDQFQDVRETLGPASGDELLRQIALRLTGSLRRSDTVARIGEDEFAVVLACDTRDGVATVSQRLERAMTEPFVVGGHRISLGEGIGVALFPEHGRDPELLLERACAAMEVAKQNRLGHLFYDPIEHKMLVEDHSATTVFETQELRAAGAA
jgi:two-component system cell cycle response regulator